MAKSRETFNKKEKEKKRLKKKQEKLDRKEGRKDQSVKGQGLEDMLAYVDEYGNISSTPPDPVKMKKVIEQDKNQISLERTQDEDESGQRQGTVIFYNASKGYGFIKDSDTEERIFVHLKALTEEIKENDKVTFDVEMTPKGLSAVRVNLVK